MSSDLFSHQTDIEKSNELIAPEGVETTHDVPQETHQHLETPSSLVNQYVFEQEIGHGSQGKIFRATRLSDHSQVVIKQLNIHSIKNWKEYELFHREAEVLQKLKLPGVAKFYEAIDCLKDEPPCSYIIQELIPGKSLQQMINESHRFTLNEVYDILIQILRILDKLHSHRPPVIHRDIKPSNIMLSLTSDDKYHVTLIDFGAVANPQVQGGGSTVAGTYGYMPPEQLMGHPVIESDIYALGAVAVQIITGKSPADLPVKDFNLIFEPEMQDRPHAFVTLLRQMLTPNVEQRLADPFLIIQRLEQLQSNSREIRISNAHNRDRVSYDQKLIMLKSIFEQGTIELWNMLAEKTPRDVPKSYEDALSGFRPKPSKNIHLSKYIHTIAYILFWLIVFVITFLFTLLADAAKHAEMPIWLKLLLTLIVTPFMGKFFAPILLLFIDNPEEKAENTTKGKHTIDSQFTVNDIMELIQNGRKTIATIVDIEYVPIPNNSVVPHSHKKHIPLETKQPHPNFRISYRFNPPDDKRKEDIIHQYITHDIPDNITGNVIPILYCIIPHGWTDTVQSMPFPIPLGEINHLDDVICSSCSTGPYKANKSPKHIDAADVTDTNSKDTLSDITIENQTTKRILNRLNRSNSLNELSDTIQSIPQLIGSNYSNFDMPAIFDAINIYIYSKNKSLQFSCIKAYQSFLFYMLNDQSSDFTVRIIQIIVNFLKQQSSSQKDIPIEIMHLISQVCHNLVIQSHNIPAHDIQSLTDILYTISKDDKVMNEQSRICAQRSHTELSGGTL